MGDFSGMGLATLAVVFVVFGLFYVKTLVKRHLLPGFREDDRRQAMAELLLLQTELQKRAAEEGSDQPGDDPPPSEEPGV